MNERRRALRAFERRVLQAPLVPPPPLTTAVNILRRTLAKSHRRSAPPAVQVLEGLFGILDNRVLGLLVELGVPDRLAAGGWVPLDDVADELGAEPGALERVLRYAASRGMISMEGGRVRATPVTEALQADAPAPWSGWVEFATSEWFWASLRHLDDVVVGGRSSGIAAATGHDFFEYVHEIEPAAGVAFDRAMAAGAVLQAIALAHALDWDEVGRVCDVGGGTGAALRTLGRYHRDLDLVLLERAEVAGRVDDDTIEVVVGDFFDAVPVGCDRYLLLAIVHDWSDTEATAILTVVADACPADGEIVVVENVLADPARDDFAAASDLLMLALATGRERTAAEYDALFQAAGLRVIRRRTLATGATAHVLRPR